MKWYTGTMDNNNDTVKIFIVLVGSYSEAPEDVYVDSVHNTLQSALNTRNDLYKSSSDLFDGECEGDEDDDDREYIDWDCMTLDNGIEFYQIVEKDLIVQ